jgi:Domain of unknown function (DUF4258)
MHYDDIRRCIPNCLLTNHARQEMEAEPLGRIVMDELLAVLDSGEIIEEYPEDVPYPSCLVLGYTRERRPLHIVCATAREVSRLIIITVYQPDPMRWEADWRGRTSR